MTDMKLTRAATFVESDEAAIKNLAAAQQIIIEFVDGFVQLTNDENPDALEYWQVARALNKAVEVYCE